MQLRDPFGLKDCKITVFVGHNFSVKDFLDKEYPRPDEDQRSWPIPLGDCVMGVTCGAGQDVDGDGKVDSVQDYLEKFNACNTVSLPPLKELDDPIAGLKIEHACTRAKQALERARRAGSQLCNGECPNPKKCKDWKDPACDRVIISVMCDLDAQRLFEDGIWDERRIDGRFRRGCRDICGRKITRDCRR